MAKKKTSSAESYIVHCEAPTPLRHRRLRVIAESPEQARERFLAKNGIAATDHPIHVVLDSEAGEQDEQPSNSGADQAESTPANPGGDGEEEA